MPPLEELPKAYLALERKCSGLEAELAYAQAQLALMKRQVFGAGKSEKLDRLQLQLKLKELEEKAAQAQGPEADCGRP